MAAYRAHPRLSGCHWPRAKARFGRRGSAPHAARLKPCPSGRLPFRFPLLEKGLDALVAHVAGIGKMALVLRGDAFSARGEPRPWGKPRLEGRAIIFGDIHH